jgi:glycosyltransferase involved in cell wall biosynthesis
MESIVERLPAEWDVSVLAINHYGDPYPGRALLYPAAAGGNDLYGIGRLPKIIDKIKPDRIFILQDSWIIQHYLDAMPEEYLSKTVIYTPVDAGPYQSKWLKKFPLVKQVCAYTNFGREILLEANPEIPDIKIIPHGIDTSIFYPIDQNEARNTLGKMEEDTFIILNTSRNQPRKRLDICAKAFGVFSANKDDVRYYHHAGIEDAGWNFVELAKRYDFDKKLILSSKDLSPQKYVTDETMNLIYNSADVGLGLSWGEGWGLCFAGGTKVVTPHGHKTIETLKIGDQVFDADGKVTTVTNTLSRNISEEIYKIRISGCADYLYVTGEHPFLAMDGWIDAKDIIATKTRILKPDLNYTANTLTVDLTEHGEFVHDDNNLYFVTNKFGKKVTKKEFSLAQKLFDSTLSGKTVRKIPRYLPINADTAKLFSVILSSWPTLTRFLHTHNVLSELKRLFNYEDNYKRIYLDRDLFMAIKEIAYTENIYMHMDRTVLVNLFYHLIKTHAYVNPWSQNITINATTPLRDVYRSIFSKLGVAYSETYMSTGTLVIFIDKKFLPEYGKSYTIKSRTPDLNGCYYKVLNQDAIAYTGTVYNLETESHTYNVMGYACHNCNSEHAVTGKPQIIAANSASLELYAEGRGIFVPISHYSTNPTILTEGAVVSVRKSAEAMEYAYTHREEIKKVGAKSREYFMQPQFRWENIAKKFQEIIES